MITPDEVENQKSDEQKRLESHWEEMEMERQIADGELEELLPDNVLRDMLDNLEKRELEVETKMEKEMFVEFDDMENEPYGVIEETHRRFDGSRYKIIKIYKRRTHKIIGSGQVELKEHGKSS